VPTDTALKPWERRLGDLAHALVNCHETYFDPELFRRNINHFLQTSRTVTFLIQKHKTSIPHFEDWYAENVLRAWAKDSVMTWAKEARNHIEKEGDLETNSQLRLSLIFSYLSEEDVHIKTGRTELLGAGLKKLVRFARARLPTGVEDAAVVRVERRWVASSLPDLELLQALRQIYMRIHTLCQDLASHLGRTALETTRPVDIARMARREENVCFLKLSNLKVHRLKTLSNQVRRDDEPPDSIKAVVHSLKQSITPGRPFTIETTFDYMTRMAEATFNHFGNHVPMLHLFDTNWQPVDFVSAHFSDQADKYIFWRSVAEQIRAIDVHGLAWTSESWIRAIENRFDLPIRKMPIAGEELHTIVLDRLGGSRQAVWTIHRDPATHSPTLVRKDDPSELEQTTPYYLVPAMRALGLPDPRPTNGASTA